MTELTKVSALSMESRGIMPAQNVEDGAWIDIQEQTFTNWVNEALSEMKVRVEKLDTDFVDGVNLAYLVGALQKKALPRIVKNPISKHQQMSNITVALEALKQDGVKLVNIGTDDVHNQNKKIILGLIWAMILKYQFADIAPKKWMILWCNSVIPELNIANLSTDWNSGIALCGLLNYCDSTLFPEWRALNPSRGLENCRRALQSGERKFSIPQLISAEHMSNTNLDEFSMLTYLSYFTRAPDGPGHQATLRWVQSVVPRRKITDFSEDWKDGMNLGALVDALGGEVRGWPNEASKMQAIELLQAAMAAAQECLEEPELLTARDIITGKNYIGMMAYISRLHNASLRANKENVQKRSPPVESPPPKRMMPPPPPPRPLLPKLVANNLNVLVGQSVTCMVENVPANTARDFAISAVTTFSNVPVAFSTSWTEDAALITLKPTIKEAFSLKVVWNDKEVIGSPARFDVQRPSLPELFVQMPTHSPVNRPCEIGIVAENQARVEGDLPIGLAIEAVTAGGSLVEVIPIDPLRKRSSFLPPSAGKYKLMLKIDDEVIPRSTQIITVYDLDDVRLSRSSPAIEEPCVVGRRVTYEVNLEASVFENADAETVLLRNNGMREPVVTSKSRASYSSSISFSFTPSKAGKYEMCITFDNGAVMLTNPLVITVTDPADDCVFEEQGDWNAVLLGSLVKFYIRGTIENYTVDVNVSGPDEKTLPAHVNYDYDEACHIASFTVHQAGEHRVTASVNDCVLRTMPRTLRAVANSLNATVNYPLYIGNEAIVNVDTRNVRTASRLTTIVHDPAGDEVPTILYRRANGSTLIRFIPEVAGRFSLMLFSDKDQIADIPFYCDVVDLDQIKVTCEILSQCVIFQKAWYKFSFEGANEYLVKVIIEDPQASVIPFDMQKTADNTFSVEFVPSQVGVYNVRLVYNNCKVFEHSAKSCKVYDPRKVLLLDVDAYGTIGQRLSFTIDTNEAGDHEAIEPQVCQDGTVAETSNSDSDTVATRRLLELQKVQVGPSRYRYEYEPTASGNYTIDVRFFGERVPDCPLAVQVFDGVNVIMRLVSGGYVHVREHSWIILDTNHVRLDPRQMNIWLTGPPNDSLVPCKAALRFDECVLIEFWPQMVGPHQVHVEISKKPIRGGPLFSHAFDAARVLVTKLDATTVGRVATFEIDTEKAGDAPILVKVMSEKGLELPCEVSTIGRSRLRGQYTPNESGEYSIIVSCGSIVVPRSPFKQLVHPTELPNAYGDGLSKGEKLKASTFFVKCRSPDSQLGVKIEFAHQSTVEAKIAYDAETSLYTVNYTPLEVGEYKISLSWDALTLPGSPFVANVVDVSAIRLLSGIPDEYLEEANASGWRVAIEEDRQLEFDTSLAGRGKLQVSVKSLKNDHALLVSLDDTNSGLPVARFRPVNEGEYRIDVHWNDFVVPPFPVRFVTRILPPARQPTPPPNSATPPEEARTIVLTGSGLHEARRNQLALFVLTMNIPPLQTPRARLEPIETAGALDVPVDIETSDLKTFACSYRPLVAGIHNLHVETDEGPVRGSPFTITVAETCFPSRVVLVNGGEPRRCKVGEEYQATIDARQAGQGELTGFAVGSSGLLADCSFTETSPQQYLFILKPQESGRHTVTIQFDGVDIPGTPFELRVTGPPDPAKVRVYGTGVQNGPLATTENVFMCDTRGAGSAELTVSVIAPSGPLPVDVQVASPKDRVAKCTYDAAMLGTYIVDVRWGNQHVPNSPFTVLRTSGDKLETALASDNVYGSRVSEDVRAHTGSVTSNSNFLLGSRPTDFWAPTSNPQTSSGL